MDASLLLMAAAAWVEVDPLGPTASECPEGRTRCPSRKSGGSEVSTNRTVIGVDTAKRVFQLHWVDMETGEVMDLKLTRARFLEHFARLCCKLGEGAMRDQGASCSPYDSALARRSCSHAMASVRAHGPRPKARSTIRASPTMPPWRANIPAWPLRSARITSKPMIVA